MLGMMVVNMGMEMIGIGMIVPIVVFFTNSQIGSSSSIIEHFVTFDDQINRNYLLIIGMTFLVVFFMLKSTYSILLSRKQTAFIFGVQENISERLFIKYLSQSWPFHLEKNSAKLIRNTIGETDLLTYQGLLPGMLLITEVLVLVGLSVVLIILEPLGASLMFFWFGLAGFLFLKITRKRLVEWGVSHKYHEIQRLKHLQQGFGGVKEIKLLGRENELFLKYSVHNKASASSSSKQVTLQQLPRIFLELFAVVGLAVLVIVMIYQEKSSENIISTLLAFVAVAFRLVPSVNRIIGAFHNMRFLEPVIDNIGKELKLDYVLNNTKKSKFVFEGGIKLMDVCYSYPGTKSVILDNLSANIRMGDSVGFVGESGVGKSTLIDVILGLLKPDSGEVEANGINIHDNLRGWQDSIGYVGQNIYLTDDTLCRNIAFGVADEGIDFEAVKRALCAAQLDGFVSGLPDGLETQIGERGVKLSGGQRQRIGIARALYHDPPILILDEATSSLDTETESAVMGAVNALQGSKTLIIVSHRLTTLENCSHIYSVRNGKLTEVSHEIPTTSGIKR